MPYVLAVAEEGLPKPARKVLRRLRHRLRGRGVAVPEAEPPPVVATLPAIDEAIEAALLSPLDPSGARIAYLLEPNPSGGVRIFELIFDPARGILECSVYTAGRGGARKFLRESGSRQGFPALPVPVESLKRLLADAAEAQPADRPLPRAFAESKSRLTRTSPETQTPGQLARASLGDEGGSLARAVELIRAREIGPWPPPEAPLRSLVQRLQELRQGRIVVTGPSGGSGSTRC